MEFSDLIEQCYEMNLALKKENLIVLNFGNASICDRKSGVIAIKPSGIYCNELKLEDIVVLDLSGKVIHGFRRPSSDTPTHLFLYQNFPHIINIVHTHSIYASSWAQAGRDIPVYGTTHADFALAAIPCTEPLSSEQIQRNYEWETGIAIKKILEKRNLSYHQMPMCNVFAHGSFAWSSDNNSALVNAVAMEAIAQMAVMSEYLNNDIHPLSVQMAEKHFKRKHGKNAYYGQF